MASYAQVELPEVISLIRRELRGRRADAVIDEHTELSTLGLSSLQVSEVVFTLEDDHGVEFDTSRAAEVRTVGDVVRLANEAVTAVPAGGDHG